VNVLAICGSLRRDSLNRALLRAALEFSPPEMSIRESTLDGIPLFDADLERAGRPASVAAFTAAISAADALLIATPEYNRSTPGVLKNALDWASRPPFFSVLRGKRIAVIGASTGPGATLCAQAELRRVLESTGASVLSKPVLGLERAHAKFAEGRLTDTDAQSTLVDLLRALRGGSAAIAPPAWAGLADQMKLDAVATPPDDEPAQLLLQAFEDEMAVLYGRERRACPPQPEGMRPPTGTFLVFFNEGRPLACGGLRPRSSWTAEIRRMFVQPPARGHGLGRFVLESLEREARKLGYRFVQLETGERNLAAQALYAGYGYARLPSGADVAYRGRKALQPEAVVECGPSR
jgi:chromate reductase, NAD(P)H dehydrogenase (quinone)